jgi:branched-chain amino acid transport system permease protein
MQPSELFSTNLLNGMITGAISGLPVVVFVLISSAVNLREFFPNVSPELIELLKFGQSTLIGSLILVASMLVAGLITALFITLQERIRKPLFNGILWTLTVGLFSEILSNRIRDFFGRGFSGLIFTGKALEPIAALIIFVIIFGATYYSSSREKSMRQRINDLPKERQSRIRYGLLGLFVVLLLALPYILGTYLSEVMNNVGIFILMGLGLNIVVGFAGLLDLGYVAFFAIGAYSMAVLTSEGALGLSNLTFWSALPLCIVIAAFAGIILGLPVLRMRGDYLAIVTLGFGEIIRILALSDLLKPYIGGAQGVLQIPKPPIGNMALTKPEQFYYIVLAGCLLAWFVSWRLSESRLGRQWMAMREDEDVAEAMGITLVSTKLLAFAIGAAFSGLAGAFFASKLTSIFPHSFKLEISINVLSLIIIGGIGSLPGVVVGAIILVGLPELLREFAEYRLLMYGALLIVMMLAKPEGFWPSAVRKRELHEGELDVEAVQMSTAEGGD